MTAELGLPPLAFDYDEPWLPVDLGVPPEQWAEGAAALLLGPGAGRRGLRLLRDRLTSVVQVVTRKPDFALVMLLCPAPDFEVKAVVRLVGIELEHPAADLDEAVALGRQIVEPEGLSLAEPAEVSTFDTAAGPAVRSRLRTVDQADRSVTELLNYAYVVPGYPQAAALLTAFPDLVEGGRWRSTVDALAAAATLAVP